MVVLNKMLIGLKRQGVRSWSLSRNCLGYLAAEGGGAGGQGDGEEDRQGVV